MPGIGTHAREASFLRQIISSERRNQYLALIRSRHVQPSAAVPLSGAFDPIKASISFARAGDAENALWLVFLITHFGSHRVGQWRYLEETFGRVNEEGLWDWESVSEDTTGFRAWLEENRDYLRRPGAGFGNHRKYESLDAWSLAGTGTVVESYVDWVFSFGAHVEFLDALAHASSEEIAFEEAFASMSAVRRFGRTARFDYLMMINRLQLAHIRPGRAYLSGATGPLRGASLLLDGSLVPIRSASDLEMELREINQTLNLAFDVLEDALCNWQKSPLLFRPFRG